MSAHGTSTAVAGSRKERLAYAQSVRVLMARAMARALCIEISACVRTRVPMRPERIEALLSALQPLTHHAQPEIGLLPPDEAERVRLARLDMQFAVSDFERRYRKSR